MNRQSAWNNNAEFVRFADFPSQPKPQQENCHELLVTVLFTTVPATLSALRRAGELAHELGARIRIFVPQVVPYPLPLNRPPVDPKFKIRQFRTVSARGTIETYIDVLLCRDSSAAVLQSLGPQSIVLIGGRKRWWPTPEQRWTRRLSEAGHHVIFVAND